MILRAHLQIMILALHLALHISSMPGFNCVLVLVRDLLLQSLAELIPPPPPFKDFRRSYIQCIYIIEEKIRLF